MDNQKGIYSIITTAVSKLRADPWYGPRLSNKWLPAEPWVLALKSSDFLHASFEINNQCYTVEGRKDPLTGEIDKSSSLRHLMGCCQDFREEETALQHLATQLGVTVDLTPKFHAELAGEGVEYSWAHAKGYYRRVPLARKKLGRENFKLLVKESTCPVKQLTRDRVCKFAARARAYICTYYCLAMDNSKDATSSTSNNMVSEKQQLLYSEIERLSKDFKVHRCALDFDRGFVNAGLKSTKENLP